MKKFILISVLALLGLTACNNDTPDMPSKHKKIVLTEPGTLGEMLTFESDYRNADALVIEGTMNNHDIIAILSTSARGRLRHVDLGQASMEGNKMVMQYIPPGINSLQANIPDGGSASTLDARDVDHSFSAPAELRYLKLPDTLEELNIPSRYMEIKKLVLPASLKTISDWGYPTIDEVYSLAQTPPAGDEYTFDSTGATLYVPKGCSQAYAAAPGWKNFPKIKEID